MKKYFKILGVFLLLLICLTVAAACQRPDPSTIQHDWSEWEILEQPTCQNDGSQRRVCKGCKKEQTETLPALGHDFYLDYYLEPSCEHLGFKTYICSRCNNSYQEELPALGHDYKIISSKDPISCTQPGEIVYECTKCHSSYTEVLESEHIFDQWSYDESNHWKSCGYCSAVSEYAPHTFDGDFCTVCGYFRNSGLLRFEMINGNALKFIGFSERTEGDISIPDYFNGLPVVSIGRAAMSNFSGGKITLPDTVTDLSENPFNNTFITGIYIGSGVTYLEPDAFAHCQNLEFIEVSPENPVFYAENNCLMQMDGKVLVRANRYGIMPQDTAAIGSYAFSGCNALENITLPDSVQTIGKFAFEQCDTLKSVELGNNVQSIGAAAFEYCRALKEITLPDSLKTIGNMAFSFCGELETLKLPAIETIGNAVFSSCKKLRTLILPAGTKNVDPEVFLYSYFITFWCEDEQQNSAWNVALPESATIYWADEWEYVDGVPTLRT